MIFDNEFLDNLTAQAKASPRLRMNFDLRNSAEDSSQRMLNALEPGTLVPVHRHPTTSETIVVLRGAIKEIFFDESGAVTGEYLLRAGGQSGGRASDSDTVFAGYGLNIPAGQWHTVEALESGTVILEVKDGPYVPARPEDMR